MKVITFETHGSFKNTENFLQRMMQELTIRETLDRYGRMGVDALSSATPVDSGLTSESWAYSVLITSRSYSITWTNSNIVDGRPIAILLQYGHGTGTGGYVEGQDYINPALKPIFDQLAEEVWKVVTTA